MYFAVPFSLAVARLLAADYVARRIRIAAEHESLRRILAAFSAQATRIVVNVLLLLAAVYGSGWLVTRRMSILVICSVYLASVVEGLVRLLRGLPDLYRIVIVHRGNLRAFIQGSVQREVYRRLCEDDARCSFVKRLFKRVMLRSNEEIAREVAQKSTAAIWGRVVGRLTALAMALVAYLVFFRVLVAPYLISAHTKLTIGQALLYPLAYTSDYFFGTAFVKQVHALRVPLF